MKDELLSAAQAAIHKAIVDTMSGYSSPLTPLIKRSIEQNEKELFTMIDDIMSDFIRTDNFKNTLRESLTHKLAKILTDKMGGEVEKRVNDLRSDPTTRAKIILAIQKVINEI